MITVGSLFSGIGGLDLGLEQAGMRTVWQVEYDDWARSKLEENFPHTEKFKDVKEVGKHNLRPVDLICGGFPCPDISISNQNGKGLAGERSGLWFEQFRILCELRPRYALIENVAKLLVFGMDRVLSDLASVGFNAQWQIVPASAFGLPHKRPRLFIFAYTDGKRERFFKPETIYMQKDDCGSGQSNKTRFALDCGRYPEIELPEYLCLDDGLSFELSEIEAAIKGYGNAVCPPVAKWIGERIIEFDHNRPLDTPDSTPAGGIS